MQTVVADMREVPLKDESASVDVSSYAFHHLRDDGKELALAEARRLLRPGGRLVVCDMMFSLSLNSHDRRIVTSKIFGIARKGPAGIVRLARNAGRLAAGRWEHPISPERWRELLEARYFVDIDVTLAKCEAGIAFARGCARPTGTTARRRRSRCSSPLSECESTNVRSSGPRVDSNGIPREVDAPRQASARPRLGGAQSGMEALREDLLKSRAAALVLRFTQPDTFRGALAGGS